MCKLCCTNKVEQITIYKGHVIKTLNKLVLFYPHYVPVK